MLLDPVWDVDRLGHCSRSFRAVFTVLCACRPAGMAVKQETNKSILKIVVRELGGNGVTEYISNFLDGNLLQV